MASKLTPDLLRKGTEQGGLCSCITFGFSYLMFLLAEKTCGEVRALQEREMAQGIKQQKGGGVMWKLSWVF